MNCSLLQFQCFSFEIDGQPIEFVLLSEQEMRETQEAFVPAFAFITHWAIMDSDRQFLWRSHNRYAYDPLSASTAHFRPYVDGSSHYVLGFCGAYNHKPPYWSAHWCRW